MSNDRYAELVRGGVGAAVARRLGLPRPTRLRRYDPLVLCDSPVLVAAVGDGPFAQAVRTVLDDHHVEVVAAAGAAVPDGAGAAQPVGAGPLGGVVLDVSGMRRPEDLEGLRAVLGPALRRLRPSGRVVVVGTDPSTLREPRQAATQRALEGVVRSVGKELRYGATANLVLSHGDPRQTERPVSAAVTFFLSGRSAYVCGQRIIVGEAPMDGPTRREPPGPGVSGGPGGDPVRPLRGRVAVVTGAARGIGAEVARLLARDGASVVCVDVPAAGDLLARVANEVRGTALQLDVTAADAGHRVLEHVTTRHGRLDVVVHNAGITRDRLLANTDESRWGSVIDVNLLSILRMNEVVLADGGIARDGRVIFVSSLSGIAGNRGQSSYAASKAGLIGVVESLAPLVAARGITVNAVAPGFIETEMTARMPVATREAGRRMNSLRQGGLPVDVAETIAWFAQPATAGISGQVLRVCGQSLLGA